MMYFHKVTHPNIRKEYMERNEKVSKVSFPVTLWKRENKILMLMFILFIFHLRANLRKICYNNLVLQNGLLHFGLTQEFDGVVHAMRGPTARQAMTTNTMASTTVHLGMLSHY